MNDIDNEYSEGLLSECCGALSLGETHNVGTHEVGICSDCHEHAIFIKEGEE